MAPINKNLITILLGSSALAAPLKARQLAGEGAAANSILSCTDNAVGYGTEDALDNVAQLISGLKPASAGTGSKPRRQLDKIANGVQAVGNAAGDNLNGTLNSAVADAGAEVADAEVSTAEQLGSSVPTHLRNRQLDKISNSIRAVCNDAGVGAETEPATTLGDNFDGQATEYTANVGAQVATDEVAVAEQAGGDVPTRV